MMAQENRPVEPPRQLHIGSGNDSVRFILSSEYLALHGIDPGTGLDGAALAFTEQGVGVFAKDEADARRAAGLRMGPVYVNATGTSFAVPTGRVFLRLREGESAETLRSAIAGVGLRIAQIPAYAPHAAWLEPATGDIAAGLAALPALRTLAGVESVEPELLQRRAQR